MAHHITSVLVDPAAMEDTEKTTTPDGKTQGAEDTDATASKSTVKLALLLVALCLAVLCQALDNTIITTAIPKITDEFNSLDDVAWYG